VLMLKSSMERWVRIFSMLFGMLHISLVSLLSTLSNFQMSSLEKGPHSTRHKLCLV
jgi:hypothetical protein